MLYATFVFLFAILSAVAAHEGGHALAARLCRLPVHQFSLGIGPSVFSIGRFHLRALPLGGFVLIPNAEINAAHPLARLFVVAAGPIASFAFAIVAFAGAFIIAGAPLGASLQVGADLTSTATAMTAEALGAAASGEVDRLGGLISIFNGAVFFLETYPIAVSASLLAAGLSISLGVVNLLPIPALDGGRLVVTLIEWGRGRALSQGMNRTLYRVSIACVIVLLSVANGADLYRLMS